MITMSHPNPSNTSRMLSRQLSFERDKHLICKAFPGVGLLPLPGYGGKIEPEAL